MSGRRRQARRRKARKMRLFLAAAAALLCVAYVICCFSVDDGVIVQNTWINGVNVGGMDAETAEAAVREKFEEDYLNAAMTVRVLEKDYRVLMHDALSISAEDAAAAAMDYAHGSLLTRGAGMLRARLFQKKYTWNPYISDTDALEEAIRTSGVLDVNTTVQTTWEVTKTDLVFTKGITGISVDSEGLIKEIEAAVEAADFDTVVEAPTVAGNVSDVDVQAIYDQVHTKKSNATLDPENDYKIVKSVRGVSFDVDAAKEALAAAAEGEQVVVPLTIKKPKITTKKLKKYLFRDDLGTCSTNVSGSSNRVSNVALAAKIINGTILLPGETFSYNDTLGERTAERGFKTAPAYSNGESVQELGGGICQVSSTLYKAVLLSNLEIVEHHNHSYVSSYIGIGMDATVSWGGPDFQFKNDTDYPIKIKASYSGGQVSCTIVGAKLDGKTVKMTAETLKVLSCDTVYQDDPTLPEGETEVISSGHEGYIVQTYRDIYNKKGKRISHKKEAYCVYKTKDRVIRRGTMSEEPDTEEDTTDYDTTDYDTADYDTTETETTE